MNQAPLSSILVPRLKQVALRVEMLAATIMSCNLGSWAAASCCRCGPARGAQTCGQAASTQSAASPTASPAHKPNAALHPAACMKDS